jgi:hypothetical protein
MMITPMRVFVLLFNARTENEGIHTIHQGGRDKILMFESQDDAERFALQLEAQDFLVPTVEAMDAEEIKGFCESANYDWEIVPADGALVIPPEINVEETNWQAEEDENTSPSEQTLPADDSQFSDSELDNIRSKLEGLL